MHSSSVQSMLMCYAPVLYVSMYVYIYVCACTYICTAFKRVVT